ncbi:transposase [Bathymodiolus japonicus methanotrophic gill symbiont]|uniref:transposase n=1 Tax=Bathymodiolus japonicus methanotrophic gill symbiont TaxID=113269 RepID=UPI001C8D0F06|nr:transposase [Bathymodiolus japonicus methanotrophic gill symbiont]
MSRKRTVYSAEFKSKLVLEVLKNEKTLQEIASANNITPKNLQNWKKIFLDNAEIAMEPSKAVKDYKEDLLAAQEQNEMLTKIVGKMTVEKEWLEKKLKSLDSSDRKQLIEPKLNTLPLTQQCALLGLNKAVFNLGVPLALNVLKVRVGLFLNLKEEISDFITNNFNSYKQDIASLAVVKTSNKSFRDLFLARHPPKFMKHGDVLSSLFIY